MTILRPITQLSPASKAASEATGLPFGFVLQPFANYANNKNDNATSNSNHNHDSNNRYNDNHNSTIINEYLIAKCTKCGSPLNTTSDFISTWNALCHLCGYVFSLDYETQQNLRSRGNGGGTDNDNYGQHYSSREEKYISRYTRAFRNDELRYETMEYSLPLFSITSSSTQSSLLKNNKYIHKEQPPQENVHEIYSLPAAMCPPLLTILIDGTSTNPMYYNIISSSIQSLLNLKDDSNNSFKGCKLAIFIMTKNGGLSVFDLNSQFGHIKHLVVNRPLLRVNNDSNKRFLSYANNDDEIDFIPLSEVMDINDVYVSLESDYTRSCIESALRVLADSIILNQACQRNHSNNDNEIYGGVYFGSTIQYILDFLKDVAYHPGMYHMSKEMLYGNHDDGNDGHMCSNNDAMNKLLYAGGKIMCFLAGPPHEIGSFPNSSGRIGTGGFGGTCSEIGKRFDSSTWKDSDDTYGKIYDNKGDENDIEAGNDAAFHGDGRSASESKSNVDDTPHTPYSNLDTYYQNLGIECAHAAISVEIFGLIDQDDNNRDRSYLGLPYLRLLSDRSGGNGPLILPLEYREHNMSDSSEILLKEFLGRAAIMRYKANFFPNHLLRFYYFIHLILFGFFKKLL